MGRLTGKVALITGGSSGIGKGIALGYAREGATVALTSRDIERARLVAGEIARAGGVSLPLAVDVRDRQQVDAAVHATEERFGRIDILVNNAGNSMVAPSESLTDDQWHTTIATHLDGAFYCCRAAAQDMLERGSGCIINMESLLTFTSFPMRLSYSAAKAGLHQITTTLALEWGPRGIRVNGIAPGIVRTELHRALAESGKLDPSKMLARTPIGRLAEVEDIVGPAIFLASDEAAYITGHTLAVDGGWLTNGYV
jgi:NAD(P)-dependent dehydrogenase (short-subunit alcohol dehydrogenase family)